MAFCSKCGHELVEGAKFCYNCGSATSLGENQEQRKTIFEGEIHKCPNCGEVLNSFVTNCPSCGYELRNIKSTSSVKELAIKLEQIEQQRPARKMRNIFSQALGGGQLTNIDEQKVNLIKNFTIPNTKEDILEFVIIASSNIDIKVYGIYSQQYKMMDPAKREISDAWLAKFEQAYKKAMVMFGGSQEFCNIQELYQKKMDEVVKKKREYPLAIIGLVGGLFLLLILIWLLVFLTGSI